MTPSIVRRGGRALRAVGAAVALGASLLGGSLVATNGHAAEPDLDGRWLMLQVTGTVAKVPVVGAIRSSTYTVVLYDLEHDRQGDGERLKGSGTTCSIDIDSGTSFVDTKLPAAFRRVLPTPRLDAQLERKNGRLELYQPPQTIVVGAKLERPTRDRMPTSADDARVVDQDKDGHPGVTVNISGIVSGDIYVAQRNWTKMRGSEIKPGIFAGRVRFGNEQVILGASTSMLESSPNARPDPKRSYFRLVRVPQGTDCKKARALARSYVR